jgi:hypothetical protein
MNLQQRAWPLLLETVAIVVSILLAFAIDAWWEDRAERRAEHAAIERLLFEFSSNVEELAVNKEKHARALAGTEALLALTGPEPSLPEDEAQVGSWLMDCFQNPTIDAHLGTVNSLIASGDLNLLQDSELQRLLVEYPALIENALEWQKVELMHGEDVMLPFTYDYVAWPTIVAELGHSSTPSRFKSDYRGLLSLQRFEGYLENRHWNNRQSIDRIEALEEKTQAIIQRLEDNLESSG